MQGLSTTEADARLARVGPNALPERPPTPVWRRLLGQFRSPLILILLFALGFDLARWTTEGRAGWPIEAVTIGTILLLNALLGIYQERRSEAALARLSALAAPQSWVYRDGAMVRLPSARLVPGDVVRLDAGDRVPADGRFLEAAGALLDESLVTGESLPVARATGDEALSGTLLVRGRSVVEITATGQASTLGRLARMLGDIPPTVTPLERRVDALGRRIARGVLLLAALLGIAGAAAEGPAHAADMFILAVALAVAAVPEGLPAVLTVALTLGVERMARRHAVIRRLAAVESLGCVTVVATDKTGTLTENRMDVHDLDSPDEGLALTAMTVVCDADLATGAGDPLELGLLRFARARGFEPDALRQTHAVVSRRPFDSAWKFARTTVRHDATVESYVMGAPEAVLARCAIGPADRDRWTHAANERASSGTRLVSLAYGEGEREEALTFLGLVSLWDPPRTEVPDAVAQARAAGIRVVMITGDHPATALAIARAVGIDADGVITGDQLDGSPAGIQAAIRHTHVFARVRPEQKLALVEALQAGGDIVAMTGDGVNDAPALKRSDIGVAMGQRGADVSREVADLVLLDDNFATIVAAVEEGRRIYENIQTFLRFLFSTNLAEVLLMVAGLALAFGLGLRDDAGQVLMPLTPSQILWINLVTDGLPALALAFDRTPGLMGRPPRDPRAALLDTPSLAFIVTVGAVNALLALALLGLLPRLGGSVDQTRATVFHFMAISQLFITYPSRRTTATPGRNWTLLGAVVAGVALQWGAGHWMLAANMLGHAAMPLRSWIVVFGAAGLSWALAEAAARLLWTRAPSTAGSARER